MKSIEEYQEHLRTHGRKETSVRSYGAQLRTLERKFAEAGLPFDPERATTEHLLCIRSMPLRGMTTRNYETTYSQFVRWATGRDLRRELDFRLGQPEAETRKWITDNDFRMMWSVADELDRCILALGGMMGLRRAEIAGLRLDGIRQAHIIVKGKGRGPNGKTRSLLMPLQVQEAVAQWLRVRAEMDGPDLDGTLLVHETAEGLRAYSDKHIGARVKELGESVGVDVTTHSLRRLFATDLKERGVEIDDIKTLMRHESIDTTVRCYIRADPARLDGIMAGIEIH